MFQTSFVLTARVAITLHCESSHKLRFAQYPKAVVIPVKPSRVSSIMNGSNLLAFAHK